MARGYAQSRSETAIPAAFVKLAKSALRDAPQFRFPPNEDGEGRTVQTDRLFGNIVKGSSTSSGNDYAGLKELILKLPKEGRADAAGLVTDLVELSYLKGIKDVRVAAAREFGAKDAEEVGARIDAQIKDVESSIKDGMASVPKDFAAVIAVRTSVAVRDADDDAQRRRGAFIEATDTKGMKKVLNEIYEELIK